MRSILTLIGIVIGVASAAFLAAQSTNASVEGSIDTLFNVYNSDAWVWFEEPIRADFTARLRAIPGVEDVERWSTVHGHLQHTRALFYGLSADTQMYRHEVVEGRWFAPGVWDEVVLTTGLAEEAGVRPGDQVTMDIWGRQRTFRVVGLAVDNITTGLGAAPIDKAFAPAETVSRLMGRQGWADFFALRTTDRSPAGVEAVLTRLEDKYGDLRLRAAATYADMEYARDVSRILTVALWAMVLIVALSGGIGVLNTLALNVMERRREIGVLRAIGAVDWSMVQVFLTEGLILGLLGAGVGLLLAYPLARYFVDTIAENMGFPIATLFTGRTAVTGVLFALVLGRRWPAWARPRARRGCVCARRCGMSERPSLLSELDRAVPKKNRTQWMRRYMMNQYRLCSPLALVLGAGTLAVLPILGFTAGSPPVAQAQNVPAHMAAITITVDTTTDSNDPAYQACTAAPNDCCLRGAISKANADSNGTYIITLPAGLYGLTLSGDEDDNAAGDLDIRRSLTILGTGAGGTIISGNQIDRVLHIQSTVAGRDQ